MNMPWPLHLAAQTREDSRVDGDYLQPLLEFLLAEGFDLSGELQFSTPGHCKGYRLRGPDTVAHVSFCTPDSKLDPSGLLGALEIEPFTTLTFHPIANNPPQPSNP
jgi:hypothetical protein